MASRNWPTVEGIVVSSEVARVRDSQDNIGFNYKPEVLYEYLVDGVKYSSNNIDFGQPSSSNSSYARKIVNRYPDGKKVIVYYKPSNPDVATLEPGLYISSFVILLFGLVFSGISLEFLVAVFKIKTRASVPAEKAL